jgi:cell wall-associated NlpC family hydrolase
LESGENLLRGDLIFWDGHVAMMVDADTMIHANAHHMAVVYEGLVQATLRIKTQGNGDVTARRRVL